MTLKEIFDMAEISAGQLGVWALVGISLIQIAPIPINPWSNLAKFLGRAINGEVLEKVNKLETKLNKREKIEDERYIKGCRNRILIFNDEILNDIGHSKEGYDNVLADVTEYEHYCNTHPDFPNAQAVMAIANIKKRYDKHMTDHDFL